MPGSKTRAKVIKITIISIISTLLLICLIGYFFVRAYINKLNIASDSEPNVQQTVEIEPEPEEIIPDATDSPENEINSIEDNIRNNMENNSTPIISDDDVFNILLIGSDSREAGGNGRSDAMIIISINDKTDKIIATSILRDIYLQIPGRSNNRLNAAFAYGGADLLMETIEQNFKIDIEYYASIDFFSFMDVVDAVGGVTINVTEAEVPILNEYVRGLNRLLGKEEETDTLSQGGTLLLNGKQALGYSRIRYLGNGDFDRTARQRKVLEQAYLKVKDLGLIELNNLLNIILPQVTTNLTEGEMFSLFLSLPTYTKYAMEQWSVPVEGSYTFMRIRGMAVIGIDFDKNIEEMHKRIF